MPAVLNPFAQPLKDVLERNSSLLQVGSGLAPSAVPNFSENQALNSQSATQQPALYAQDEEVDGMPIQIVPAL